MCGQEEVIYDHNALQKAVLLRSSILKVNLLEVLGDLPESQEFKAAKKGELDGSQGNLFLRAAEDQTQDQALWDRTKKPEEKMEF